MIDCIAEFGQSHGGNLATAKTQAAIAMDAGCTWAKWQTFQPERLVSRTAGRYWDPTLGGHPTQLETFQANGMLRPSDWRELAVFCRDIGIGFMSSPFDLEAVDLLVDAGVGALKIASGEITHRQLLERVAQTGLPIVLSTGAATVQEIMQAIDWLGDGGNITLLACTLAYPTADDDAELGRIEALRVEFPWVDGHGYSDHTLRTDTALAAVVAGATMLEKHVTLNPDGGVPDDRMALDPPRLRQYVAYARLGERMRGTGNLAPTDAEMAARAGARRSVHAATNIPAGKTLQVDDFAFLRPGGPFAPADVDVLVGKRAAVDISAGDQIHSVHIVW
jgi:N,N'-diacetyllegionaminate synthase